MSIRFFTIAEANAVIKEIRPLMKELIEHQARIAENFEDALGSIPQAYQNVGSPAASRLARDFAAVESLIEQIKSYGCQIKDIRLGLIDFLAEIDGREVNLCWRFDEEEIAYYHDLDEGYANRRPLGE